MPVLLVVITPYGNLYCCAQLGIILIKQQYYTRIDYTEIQNTETQV